MAEQRKVTPRVRDHVDKLREAGLDTQKFFDVLCAIRDDSALPRTHRDAIYKLIAMESFVWYLEALRDERIDRVKLKDEVNRVAAEYEAAIRKQEKGEKAMALAQADIGAGDPKTPIPQAPQGAEPPPQRAGKPASAGAGPRSPRKAPRGRGGPRRPQGRGRPRARPARPRKK